MAYHRTGVRSILNNNQRKGGGDVVSKLQQKWKSCLQIYTAVSKDAGSQRVAFGIAVPQIRTHEDNRISDHDGDALWALWLVEDNKPK